MYQKNTQKTDVVIDIETVTDPVTKSDIDAYMAAYEPPGNISRPETLAKHRDKAEVEAVEKIAKERLASLGGKRMISCALGAVNHRLNDVVNIESFAGEDLKEIAYGIVQYLDEVGDYRLVGWNHKSFDMPELCKTFFKTGIKPRFRPGKWDLIDMCEYPFRMKKLKDIAKALELPVMDIDGSNVLQLYNDGNWDVIKQYNEHDVMITGKVYLALSTLYSF